MEDDVVIEIKVRLSELTYDEARAMRDVLRKPSSRAMLVIISAIEMLGKEVAPNANIGCFSPWAEWRPAKGKRQNRQKV